MRSYECDVAIVGGGPAGIAAAVAVSRCGMRGILLERAPFFGGNATASSVAAFCGFYTRGADPDLAVAGIGQEVIDRLRGMGRGVEICRSASGNTTVKFDVEDLKTVLDELVMAEGLTAMLHATAVSFSSGEHEPVIIGCFDDEGPFEIHARQCVDATGDATLVHLAGASTVWGDENGAVQQASLVFRLDGLPCREIHPDELKAAIVAGKRIGIAGLVKEGGVIIKHEGAPFGYCTIPSSDITGLDAKTLTGVEMTLRAQVRAYAEAFRRFIPDMKDSYVSYSGPSLGLRESRRIVGESVLTGENILRGAKVGDSIARASWSPEIHKACNDPVFHHIADNDYASIPLGCLRPAGLLRVWVAGRSISSDPLAFASVRVMGTAMATGHAAGVAAALSAIRDADTVGVDMVQEKLLAQGALI